VQKHIDTLEAFRTATIESGRKQFCKDLAASGRILASDLDKAETAALAMDDASFEGWKGMMGLVQPSSIVQPMGTPSDSTGQHSGGTIPGQTGQGKDPKADRIEVLEATVKGLFTSGMKEAQVHNTGAYKELQKLQAQSSTNAA
jgi:hypothetical protein